MKVFTEIDELNIFHITKISIYRKISHLYLLGPYFVAGISGLTFKNNEKKNQILLFNDDVNSMVMGTH